MTHTSTISAWSRDLGSGALAIIAVSAASFVGQLATYPNLAPWYAGLAKRLWCKRQKRGIFPANSPFAEANSDAEHG